jgi:hypothetical protein
VGASESIEPKRTYVPVESQHVNLCITFPAGIEPTLFTRRLLTTLPARLAFRMRRNLMFGRAGYGRTRETLFGGFRIKLRGHPASCVPVLAKLENPKVASFGMATLLCTAYKIKLSNSTFAAMQPSRSKRNRAEKLLSHHQGHPGHPATRSGA